MRTFTKKLACLLMVLLCCVNVQLKADELTVNDGTATNLYVPLYGYYADTSGKSQFVVSSDDLSGVGSISGLTFYASSDFAFTAVWEIKLMETSEASVSSAFLDVTGATLVYTGTIAISSGQASVVFDNAFTYSGENNLLVEVALKTTGNCSSSYSPVWYGVNTGTSRGGSGGSPESRNFLPKVTFEYTPGAGPSCAKPETFDVTGVTASSAAFTWAGGSGTYNLEYKKASADKWTVVLESTTATTHTLTGLEANTAYQARVNCVCGEEASGFKTISFQTPIALPYVQPFSTSSTPDGWGRYTGVLNTDGSATLTSSTSYWTFGTYNDVFDSHAHMEVWSTRNAWLVSPTIPMEANQQLTFDLALTYYSGSNVPCSSRASQPDARFVVLVSADGNNWVTLREWNNTGSEYVYDEILCSADGEEVEIDLSDYSTGNLMFAFYVYHSTGGDNRIHVDNFKIAPVPSCRKPTGLAEVAGKATKNSIQVDWTPVTSETAWKVQYKKASDSEWSVLDAASHPFTISGLLAFTDYNVRVAAVCGEELTDYGNQITAKTAAGVPFEQSFAKSSLPSDWKRYTGLWEEIQNGGELESTTSGWSTIYKTYANANGVFPDSTYHLYLNIAGAECNSWLVSPTIEMEAGYQLTFNMSLTPKSATSPKAVTAGAQNDDQFILAVYDAENGWTALRTWDNSGSAFDNIKGTANGEVVKVSLDDYAGKAIQIAFYGESSEANGDNNLHIQNLNIATVPACENTTSLDVAAISGTTATLVWDAVGGATWQYFHMVKPEGEFTPTDDKFTNSSNGYSVELTGLDENTDYVFYFRRKCGDTEYSDILMREFKTSQTPASIPFTDNFEGSNCGWLLINGDQTNAWVCGSATNNGGAKSLYISDDNGDTHEYNVGSACVVYATKTFTFAEAGIYSFSYDWKANGESSCDYMRVALAPQNANVVAGTLYNGLDASSTPSNWIALDGGGKLNLKTEWQHVSLEYNIEEAGTYKVVILWRNDGSMGTQTPAAIDNFSISRVLCNAPSGLALDGDPTASSASFQWNDDQDGNSWAYAYALASAEAPADAAYTNVDNNSVSIDGLAENSNYIFYLRKNCGANGYSEAIQLPFKTLNPYQITINDGTTTNEYVPVNGYNADYGTNGQFIIPAATLDAIAWDTITNLTFYSSTASIDWGSNEWEVYMAEVSSATISAEADWSGLTKVKNAGSLSVEDGEMAFALDVPFQYKGGNLLIGFKETTSGSYKRAYWYGVSATGAAISNDASYGGVNYTVSQRNFLPKMAIDFKIGQAPQCSTPKGLVAVADSLKSDSAFIKWTEQGTASTWILRYRKSGVEKWDSLTVNVDSLWLEDLTPATTYEVQVASWCDPADEETITEFSGSIEFTTACVPVSEFPWSENFNDREDANIAISCWENEHIAGARTEVFTISSGTGSNTSKAAKLPDMNDGNLTLLSLPEMNLPAAVNGYRLKLDVYRKNYSTTKYKEGLRIYASATAQLEDTVLVAFIPRERTVANATHGIAAESADGWCSYKFNLPVASGACRIFILGVSEYGSFTLFDNLVVEKIPDCQEPEDLAIAAGVDSITTTTARLTWTALNGETAWNIQYRKASETEWSSVAADSNPFELTGLTPSTIYYARVAAACSSENSVYSDSISFITECAAISVAELPYSQNFDEVSNLPLCWTKINTTTYSSYQGYPTVSGKELCFYSYMPTYSTSTNYDPQDQYAILPEMENINTLRIKFDARKNSTYNADFVIGVMSDPADTATFVVVDSIKPASSTAVAYEVKLNMAPAAAKHIAIKLPKATSSYRSVYIDNVVVEEIPNCLEPAGAISVKDITVAGATLFWNNEEATSWKYAIALASDAEPVDEAFVAITDTFKVFNNLSENSAYIFYLRRDCGSLMSASISASFTTKQAPADPTDFSDNFEGAIGWQFINGNLTNAWVIDTAAHKDGAKAMYISNDGGKHNKYTTSSAAMVYATKLFNFAETGTYKVDFDWLAGGESSSDYMRVVLVPDSIALAAATTTPSGFSSSALPQAWNAIAVDGGSKLNLKTSWQHFSNDEVLVDKAGLYKLVFAWRNDGSVGNDTAATLDNFSIEKLSCVKPSALAAKLTEGNGSIATLSWKKGDAESEWVVNYSLKADLSDSIEVAVTDTFINLTGLMSDSTYYARVLSVCGGTRTNWTDIISFTPTNAVTLTINKGTQTNSLVPIASTYLYQYNYEEGSRSQFIIPADSLTDVQWGKIKQLTFFSTKASQSFGNATFEVYMGIAPAATFASDAFTTWTSMEKVMNAASLAVEGNKMVVTLDEPYDYTGGDLLIGIKSVASAYISSSCYWQGITATNAAVASEYDYDYYYDEYYEEPERKNFLPKMGIAYIPGEEPSCLKPTGLTVTYNGGDSAVVNWTSDAASWNIDVNGVVTAVSAKPYTIHGLSLATAYAVKVQAVCGPANLSEWTAAQNFATDVCNAEDQQPISYILSDSYGDGWNGGATLKVIHKATSKEIAALTLSGGSSSNGTLPLCCGEEYSFVWVSGTFDTECSFVIKDVDDAIILSQSSPTAGSLGDYTMVCPSCIKPSAVVIPDSTITATTAVVHWTAGHSSQTTWQLAYDTLQTNQPDTLPTFKAAVTETHDMLTGLLPEHTYFVYVRAYCGPADSSKWANVKSFTTASLCQKPSGLAMESATTSALTISWNTYGQTGFNLRYGTDGTNWTVVNGIETSPYTIEGLAASTSYKVQLQAACAAAEANSWTTSLSAKTAYGIPFEEKFNATTIPTDWNQYSGMLVDGTIDQSKSSTYSWLFGTNNGVFDSHARLNICGASTNKLLVTPTIQVSGNTQLTFDIALSYWSGTLTPATAGQQADDKFVVLVSTDEGATWTVLRQWDNAGSEYVYDNIPCTAEGEPVTINLSAYSGQGVKLAFYGESTIAGGDNYLHVDNVLVDLIPTCLKPTKFNVSNVKAHTAKLAWTAGEEGQTAWQIAIDSVDFKPDTLSAADLAEILIDVTDTPYVVSGLKPEHTYYVYVRANCGSEDGVSRWSDKKSFTTTVACPAPTGLQAYLTPGNGAVAGLKWNGEAESWTVQYGTNNTFADGTYVELGDLQNDTIGLTSLTAEATYYARVKANCGNLDGESEWSSIVSFVPTNKYQLLINDGTATNEFIPVYGWYVDYLTRSQFIIPAETLEPLQWDTIKHLTFYTSSPANVNYGAATFEVFVAEVDQKTFASNALYDWTEMDTVMAAGSLSVSGNKMEVEFTKPYQYQDGNLLIGIKQGVKGSATHTYWYGVTATGASLGGYQGTSGLTISQQNFLPKMMIEFVPGVEPLCKDPKHLKMDEVTAHSATFSWGAQLGANWQYAVAPAGEQPDEFEATTANSVEVINLNELTDYVFYLRRNCGEDGFSNIISLAFTTEAHITTVPFADDFEGANYWKLNNGSLENAWVIGSAVANAGNRSLYISNDGGQNNTYNGDAQAAVFATLLIHLDKDSIYVFQYDWKCEGEYYEEDGALDYMRVAIVPATVETAAGLTPPDGFAGDALPAGWIALDGGQALVETDAWQHVSVDTALTAGDYKVVIAWVNDEADAGETAAAIDNFSIAYKPGQATGFNDGLIDSDKAVKFIRNNHVYILVNGRIYDATGRRVK